MKTTKMEVKKTSDEQKLYKIIADYIVNTKPVFVLRSKSEYGGACNEKLYQEVGELAADAMARTLGLNVNLVKGLYWLRASYFTPYGQAGKKFFFEYLESKGISMTEEEFAVRYMEYALAGEMMFVLTQNLRDMIAELAGPAENIKTPEVELIRLIQDLIIKIKIIEREFGVKDFCYKIIKETQENTEKNGVLTGSVLADEYFEKIPPERRKLPDIEDDKFKEKAFAAFDEICEYMPTMLTKKEWTVTDCVIDMVTFGDYLFE